MSETQEAKPRGGCFSKLLFLAFLGATAGLGVALCFAILPQDLSDIGGYKSADGTSRPRDLKVVLKNSHDRGYPLTLTETEINQWLAQTVSGKQGGIWGGQVSLDQVLVRLEENVAEVILVRSILGKQFTVSMYLQIERMEGNDGPYTEVRPHGEPFHPDFPKPPKGGRIGRLSVPQGFLLLVMPSYKNLAAAFPEEITMAFPDMVRIHLEKDQITLDPREPFGTMGLPNSF